jgi:hypothetical protein
MPEALGLLPGLPGLRSLSLSGLQQVTDAAGPILASLPLLEVLDVGGTSVGDGIVDALTYSRRLAAWAQQQGAYPAPELPVGDPYSPYSFRVLKILTAAPTLAGRPLSAEQQGWPHISLKRLTLQGTHVTQACLPLLEAMEGLQYLDVRQASQLSSSSS